MSAADYQKLASRILLEHDLPHTNSSTHSNTPDCHLTRNDHSRRLATRTAHTATNNRRRYPGNNREHQEGNVSAVRRTPLIAVAFPHIVVVFVVDVRVSSSFAVALIATPVRTHDAAFVVVARAAISTGGDAEAD